LFHFKIIEEIVRSKEELTQSSLEFLLNEAKIGHVYEDWIVGVHSESNMSELNKALDLIKKSHRIKYKIAHQKNRKKAHTKKRDSDFYQFSKRIDHDRRINSRNILDHYYSVEQVRKKELYV
jgi:hypothetical protein